MMCLDSSLAFPISPSQGPCCTAECTHKGKSEKCREESECAHQGMCNGASPSCPTSEPKANFTACHGETQVCLNGVSSFTPERTGCYDNTLSIAVSFWSRLSLCSSPAGLLRLHLREVRTGSVHLCQPRWQGWDGALPCLLHGEKCVVFQNLLPLVHLKFFTFSPLSSASFILSEPKHVQQHRIRALGSLLQQKSNHAASWLAVQRLQGLLWRVHEVPTGGRRRTARQAKEGHLQPGALWKHRRVDRGMCPSPCFWTDEIVYLIILLITFGFCCLPVGSLVGGVVDGHCAHHAHGWFH